MAGLRIETSVVYLSVVCQCLISSLLTFLLTNSKRLQYSVLVMENGKTMNCTACNIECRRFGKHRNGLQRFRCAQCGRTYTEEHSRLFGSMTIPEDKGILALQLLIEGTSI